MGPRGSAGPIYPHGSPLAIALHIQLCACSTMCASGRHGISDLATIRPQHHTKLKSQGMADVKRPAEIEGFAIPRHALDLAGLSFFIPASAWVSFARSCDTGVAWSFISSCPRFKRSKGAARVAGRRCQNGKRLPAKPQACDLKAKLPTSVASSTRGRRSFYDWPLPFSVCPCHAFSERRPRAGARRRANV